MRDSEPSPPEPPCILWESETALVVQKRSGELVHNSHFAGPKEFSLKQRVGTFLGRRVYPVHRLDRGTSGALMLARESETTGQWQDVLAAGEKDYLALVRGRFLEERLVERVVRDESGVEREARTTLVPLAQSSVERVTLVAARLHTGRHHQARRHCVHLRHPILGDSTHGDTKFNRAFRDSTGFGRLGLHAIRLRFAALEDGAVTEVFAPLPAPFARLVETTFGLSTAELQAEFTRALPRLAVLASAPELRPEIQK